MTTAIALLDIIAILFGFLGPLLMAIPVLRYGPRRDAAAILDAPGGDQEEEAVFAEALERDVVGAMPREQGLFKTGFLLFLIGQACLLISFVLSSFAN